MKLFLAILFLTTALVCRATDYTAASATYADVNTAMGLCSNGDTLVIPAGDETWASTLTVTKNIDIRGNGKTGGSRTRISYDGGTIFELAPTIDAAMKISGISFDKVTIETGNDTAIYITKEISTGLWIDDCEFNFGGRVIWSTQRVYGLISDCDVYNTDIWLAIQNESSGDDGAEEWTLGRRIGTTDTMVVEDCTFTWDSASDGSSLDQIVYGQNATRVVFRNNTVDSSGTTGTVSYIDMHGKGSYGKGAHVYEVYDNTWTLNNGSPQLTGNRGGTLIAYNNTVTIAGDANRRFTKFRNESLDNASPWLWDIENHVNNSYFYNNTLNGDSMATIKAYPYDDYLQRTTEGEVFDGNTGSEWSAGTTPDAWVTATAYVDGTTATVPPDFVVVSDQLYECILAHTSGASDEPGVGGSWETYWVAVDYHFFTRASESGDTDYPYTALTYPHTLRGSTYYIDYVTGNDANDGLTTSTPWKYSPTQSAFTGSWTHVAGDRIVMKGGVTWPLGGVIFGIGYSGTAGNVTTITGGQLETVPWGVGYPILDGESLIADWSSIVEAQTKSYLKINGLHIINGDASGDTDAKTGGIRINNSDNIEISNCKIQSYGKWGIKMDSIGDNVLIHHNDFSDTANYIESNSAATDSVVDGLLIYNNDFHDPASMMTASDHVDGIHLFAYSGGFTNGTFTNAKIYNNHFYGDWASNSATCGVTGTIFLENRVASPGIVQGIEIYNNIVDVETAGSLFPGTTMGAIFSIGGVGLKVFNNTIIINDTGETGYVIGMGGTTTGVELENNIITGQDAYCLYFNGVDASSALASSDYNILETTATNAIYNNATPRTYAYWQATMGYDANGSSSAPSLDANYIPEFGDTVALNQGTAQTIFTTDHVGTSRPQESVWDIGALEFIPGLGDTATVSGDMAVGGTLRFGN